MKKTVLICAAVLAVLALASAPVSAATKINFGLKAGVSFSNVAWSDDDGTEKALVRPTFGGFALIPLTPMLSLQPEVNYLVTGEWWSSTLGNDVEAFTYLHIPVLLRARLMKEGKFIPVVFAGPAISFLLSAKEDGDNVKEFFKDVDFGLDFGVGAETALGDKIKGMIDLRFYLGLSNNYSAPAITAEVLPMAISSFTMYNRALSLTLGVIF
jgi:hypothetical protein